MIKESELQAATELYKTFVRKCIGHVSLKTLSDNGPICVSVYTNIDRAKKLTDKVPEMQHIPSDELGPAFEVAHFNFPE